MDGAVSPRPDVPPTRVGGWIKLALLAAVIAGACFAAWKLGFFGLRDPHRLALAIQSVRGMSGIQPLFVAAYAIVTTFGLPAFPLTLASGAIFGLILGSFLSWLGAVLGASGAYMLARSLGRDAFRGVLGTAGDKLSALGERRGFVTIVRLRLVPVVPFNVVSLASGLAGVPFRDFIVGTALGIIPGTIIYTYFATSLLAGVSGAGHAAFMRATIAAALLLAVSYAPWILQQLRGRSRERQ
ncbi:MAG: hypothetical protein NVS4B3_01360 [Gemmatimonadaceae bacterium]